MPTLKRLINRYLLILTSVVIAVMLAGIVYIQCRSERKHAYEASLKTFAQIDQVLERNSKELDDIRQEYRRTCLNNAKTIARVIEGAPEVIGDVEALKEIAGIVGVDEIHFFDDKGCIYAGTHPEYYGLTFDSGEQMEFFKPMLEDRSLELVQDITPNTAEAKLMQYSALWSQTGDIIVQVGMEPVNVMKVTEKNELSYIFSLFRVDPESNYYAIDEASGRIVGSTVLEEVGKSAGEIGLTAEHLKDGDGFFAADGGEHFYCAFQEIDGLYLGRVISERELYRRVPATVFQLAAGLIVFMAIMSVAISISLDRFVVRKLQDVNEKLQAIAMGDLDETVDIRSSLEFSELSRYLNIMVKSLLDENKKMSYVLSKTNLYIGVYEYSHNMKRVRYTEHLPMLLALSDAEMRELAADRSRFKAFMDKLRKYPVANEPGVFQFSERSDRYIKLEEVEGQNEYLGVAIDVTDDILRRKKIELERDADPLTGLYNRRGLDRKLDALFLHPEELGRSAFVMLDADGLKGVNDTYGHEKGDIYLKKIAELIRRFEPEHSVTARQGGDEFVLFLYRYEDEASLTSALKALEEMQDSASAHLDEEVCIPLRFSLGYCLTGEETDYRIVLKEADRRMYENKRARKEAGFPMR